MTFTPFTLITTIIVSIVIIGILNIYLSKVNYEILFSAKALIVILLIPLLRMFIPIEFSFTKVIRSYTVYPAIVEFMTQDRIVLFHRYGINLMHTAMLVWCMGFAATVWYNIHKYRKYIACFAHLKPLSDEPLQKIVHRFFSDRGKKAKPVHIVRTTGIQEPLIFGVFRPTIVLPDGNFSEQELKNIIGHELGHYTHGDLLLKWLLDIFCAVYWWLAPIYRFKEQIDYVMEIRADQAVIGGGDVATRTNYMKTLWKICRQKIGRSASISSTAMFSFGDANTIKRRFNAIIKHADRKRVKGLTAIFCAVLAFIVALPFTFVVQPFVRGENIYDTYENYSVDRGTFLVQRDDGWYDMYIDNQYLGEVKEISDDMKDIPIINK